MVDYTELFHKMIIESQGQTHAERSPNGNPIDRVRAEATRAGVLIGITLGLRTMAEAGHLDQQIYDDWQKLAHSEEFEKDPKRYRDMLLWDLTEIE